MENETIEWGRAKHLGLRAALLPLLGHGSLLPRKGVALALAANKAFFPAAGLRIQKRQQGCTQSKVLRTPPHNSLVFNCSWYQSAFDASKLAG